MGLFAALMTYLVAATLIVSGMVAGFAVFFSQGSDIAAIETPRPQLVRAADRKASAGQQKPAAAGQPVTAATPGPAVNPVPADAARPSNATPAKELAGQQPSRKKKVAKSAPAAPAPQTPAAEPATETLGYSSAPPRRKFIFPFDPDW